MTNAELHAAALRDALLRAWEFCGERLLRQPDFTDQSLQRAFQANNCEMLELHDQWGELLTVTDPAYDPALKGSLQALNPWFIDVRSARRIKRAFGLEPPS